MLFKIPIDRNGQWKWSLYLGVQLFSFSMKKEVSYFGILKTVICRIYWFCECSMFFLFKENVAWLLTEDWRWNIVMLKHNSELLKCDSYLRYIYIFRGMQWARWYLLLHSAHRKNNHLNYKGRDFTNIIDVYRQECIKNIFQSDSVC